MSDPNQFYETCFLCGKKFEFGSHKYYGKKVPYYEFMLCDAHYQGNWDGFAPHYEDKIIKHLKENNIPIPKRNEKGWLPRDI